MSAPATAPERRAWPAAGWGGAPKEQVQQMVLVHLGIAELGGPLDVTDAIAVALTRLADARLEQAMSR
jgi:Holliday junction resolvasome RuvABC endonuclease subunit